MKLKTFKEIFGNKTPMEKLGILMDQIDTLADDKANAIDAKWRRNLKEADFWRMECVDIRERINWLYQEICHPEARILKADEIRALPRASIVWVEFFNAEEGEATQLLAAIKCKDARLIDEDTCEFIDFERDMAVQGDGYWRFWSAEPTEEQRKAVPW